MFIWLWYLCYFLPECVCVMFFCNCICAVILTYNDKCLQQTRYIMGLLISIPSTPPPLLSLSLFLPKGNGCKQFFKMQNSFKVILRLLKVYKITKRVIKMRLSRIVIIKSILTNFIVLLLRFH